MHSQFLSLSRFAGFSSTTRHYASHSSDSVTAADPETIKAREWFNEGTQKWNNDDLHGALDCFEKSAWTKATGDAYYNIANCQLQLGRHEAAIKSWKKSLELSPNRSDAHVNIANVHALILKDPETALSHYEEALRLEPNDGEIHYNYAVVLDSMGRLEKAVEEYKLAVQNGTAVAEKNLRNAMARLLTKKAEDAAKGAGSGNEK
ncbi:uncharacterized protein SPPG_07800 [Spizellomyces punctatus DAOM BR117]|uniref:Uncharacterized protein n=1 Tax=Spizellomyces punctatus (strain DAOM BR117) TaxID=645134 RepID=A0A0L0H6W8_SPIPD|nr:uncharacterized protein SPPG_07800 [Spizellomyces punctatus DAOM BR117]KNC96982.1 hypothetical protein SPPG_07800 [Spizellomyces punctatus DAOM BR117]|eukprot:XP_016605022.1 hypothetical protein SPPG_07800 [Spizellomyces punctatus DAOM BR117]